MYKKWHKLANGYWLKVIIAKPYNRSHDWFVSIAVGKTKRIVNNHYCKTWRSPKKLFNKSTNYKGGLEALMATLKYIQAFAKTLPTDNTIIVEGSNKQRNHVYSRLTKYGFVAASYFSPGYKCHKLPYYFLDK